MSRLSHLVMASKLDAYVMQRIKALLAMPEPDWKMAGDVAVGLQKLGLKNNAEAVQDAATNEDLDALREALRDIPGLTR